MEPLSTGAISNLDAPASSQEVRALVTVMWELAAKLDKIMSRLDTLLGPHPSDFRNKSSDLYRPR